MIITALRLNPAANLELPLFALSDQVGPNSRLVKDLCDPTAWITFAIGFEP